MKMIYCTYNVSVSEEVQKVLHDLEIENYQVFEEVLAKTSGSVPRLNTPVWPGLNNSVLVQMEESDLFIKKIKTYNKSVETMRDKIFCYSWEVEPIIG